MGGTPHIRIGLDTAHYSESGGDTAQENVFKPAMSKLSWQGGDTAQKTQKFAMQGVSCQMLKLELGHRI